MEPPRAPQAAPPGSLNPTVVADLKALRELDRIRDQLWHKLLGRNFARSAVREEVVRLAVLAFGEGHFYQVSDFVRLCRPYATAPTVRTEIERLVESGVVVRDPDGRSAIIHPTDRLIAFYNHYTPWFRDRVLQLWRDSALADCAHCRSEVERHQ